MPHSFYRCWVGSFAVMQDAKLVEQHCLQQLTPWGDAKLHVNCSAWACTDLPLSKIQQYQTLYLRDISRALAMQDVRGTFEFIDVPLLRSASP